MTIDTQDRADLPAVSEEFLLQPTSALEQFNRDGKAAYAIAQSIAMTPFVPESYKKRGQQWLEANEVAANVAAAFLAGSELGIKPMQSLQSINIIKGTPALSALAMRALVQSHGHEVWVLPAEGSGNSLSVTVKGRRKGSDHVQESTWTLARARQAGLLEKDNWLNHPLEMCTARATSAVCRLVAADVLLGLAYSVEELEDEETLANRQPTVMRRQRAAQQPAEPEPEQQPEEPAAEPQEPHTPPREEPAAEPEPDSRNVEEVPHAFFPQEKVPGRCVQCGLPRVHKMHPDEEPEPEPEPEREAICGHPKPENPQRICSRPPGHEGRHHFGAEAAAVAPVAPEPEPEQERLDMSGPERLGVVGPRPDGAEGFEWGRGYPQGQDVPEVAFPEEEGDPEDHRPMALTGRQQEQPVVEEPPDDPWGDFQ